MSCVRSSLCPTPDACKAEGQCIDTNLLRVPREQRWKAAQRTLEHLGYTYHGGELWKPPLGQPRPSEREACAALCEQIARDLARDNKHYRPAELCRDAILARSKGDAC